MTDNNTSKAFGLAVLLLAIAGCQYNGSLMLEPNGSAESHQKLAAFKEKLKTQREAAVQQEPAIAAGASAGQPTGAQPWASRPETHLVADRLSTNPTASIGLYGALPKSGGSLSSPMDSPDNIGRVTFSLDGADFDPDLDQTGQLLVFASTRHRPKADIYVKNVGGKAVTQLTNDPATDMMPAISPDGQRIAFASDRTGNWDIYIMETSGGQAVQLTTDSAHDLHPSFSPDGKKLVYSHYGAQSGQWELVVIDVDNPATPKFIINGLNPNWSPTDNRIVFQRARERGTRWFSVWTVDMKDCEAVRPTEVAASSNAAVITPDWSPDGKHIVFCTVIESQADETTSDDAVARTAYADVWVVDRNGGGRANLTSSRFADLQPVWAPGDSIYFVSNRGQGGTENIWTICPDRALRVAAGREGTGKETDDASAMVPAQ